jgi:hypothetical protein
MNNSYKNKRNLMTGTSFLCLAFLAMLYSCNKTFPNQLPGSSSELPPNLVARKTLVIVVDGAVGSEVKLMAPPSLNSLVDFSIFTWDGLANLKNAPISNPNGWATLLTGTNSDKHNVTGPDFSGNNFAAYPSLFTRLKQERPLMRTAAFFSSPGVADNLAADATLKNSYGGDDAALKDAVKAELSTQDPGLVFAQFHSVDVAGAASSYTATSATYKAAMLQVDAYIGELLTAMRARSNFKNENWMVIITSNKGSNSAYVPTPPAQWTAFDDTRNNTFFFCYNPRFKSFNPTKPGSLIPYIGTSPFYNGTQANNRRAKVLTGGTTYDIGSTGSYTIQCKVKFPVGSFNYPAFLSKRAGFTGGVVGWLFFREGDYWQVNFGQTGLNNRQIRGHAIADGAWHTLTVVIRQEGAARNVYTFTDGVLYPFTGTKDIASFGNLNSPQPLTVGNLPPDNNTGLGNYLVTDIRIYNTDLSNTYIANNSCKKDVEATDTYKNNLLGFWPCDKVNADKTMDDLSGNNRPLTIESYNPGSFSDLTTRVCPLISDEVYKTVPLSVDIAPQVFQWFGILVPPSWNLDGRNWVPAYSDLGG